MKSLLLTMGVLALASCSLPAYSSAQASQVREREPAPFERPKPIVTIASPSNNVTLMELKGILTARGYTTTSVEPDRGELEAIKRDSPLSDRSDRVILWLERDPVNPAGRAYIHFLYGRFEPFFGSTEGPVRVRLAWPSEFARMSALQDSVVAFAVARP